MCYFLVWLGITIWHATFYIKFKYLIFLTHWGFIVWNTYLVVSAFTAIVPLWDSSYTKSIPPDNIQDRLDLRPKPTCVRSPFSSCLKEDTTRNTKKTVAGSNYSTLLPWYYKLQWVSFLIGAEYAIAISILYWSMFYDPNSEHNYYSLDSLNLHLINGIAALLDLWLSGMPVSIYHAIYSISFGLIYILFTGIYYVADGTDPDGNRFIYQVLDYGTHPGPALGMALLLTVLLIGSVHYFLFIHYVFRYRLSSRSSTTTNQFITQAVV